MPDFSCLGPFARIIMDSSSGNSSDEDLLDNPLVRKPWVFDSSAAHKVPMTLLYIKGLLFSVHWTVFLLGAFCVFLFPGASKHQT